MAPVSKRTILMVEDDPDDARMVFLGLEAEHDLSVVHVRTGADALHACAEHAPHAILVDQRLPDTNGVALIGKLRAAGFEGPMIMVSGVRDDRVVGRALRAGASDFLVKDLDFAEEIAGRLRSLVEA